MLVLKHEGWETVLLIRFYPKYVNIVVRRGCMIELSLHLGRGRDEYFRFNEVQQLHCLSESTYPLRCISTFAAKFV